MHVTRHEQPAFSGKTGQTDASSGWWQYFGQILSSLLGATPTKKSHFKIRANDSIPDGTLITSGVLYKPQQKSIVLMSPEMMTAVEVNRSKDDTLTAHLTSSSLQKLKDTVPSASASEKEEIAFLKKLNQCTNRKFDRKGIPDWKQVEISEQDYYLHYYEKLDDYNEQGQYGERPKKLTQRLLGVSMDEGVGVCRHRAITNVLSIRKMHVPGLTATYTMGLMKEILERDSNFSSNAVHAYNVVTMPSGKKYVVDPFNDPLKDGSGTVLPKKKIGGHKYPLNYVSFDHILKHGNPNLNKPVFKQEQDDSSQESTWLIRPSLAHKESYQTI